jgi:hypothetical protein
MLPSVAGTRLATRLSSDSTDENYSYTGVKHAGSGKSLASWQPFPPARRKAGFFLLLTIDIVIVKKLCVKNICATINFRRG